MFAFGNFFFLKMVFFFKILFGFVLFCLREGRENERERYQSVASRAPPSGDLACNPGVCPDWESNWQPSGLWDDAQHTEPHHSELVICFESLLKIL